MCNIPDLNGLRTFRVFFRATF
ncbi:hypothetical protein BIW11_02831 [Tropilaelaps mercedesae]|uniref:Uncharacterized protein n=1 Tax=Tropilaelaps mercedesae TaxID=418985 RepID=A0A1V9XWM2_9ACAR|nr:hypothetical protein BIW11_02831 [Tropilaelaps mercedesae]